MAIDSNACPTCSEILPIVSASMATSSRFEFNMGVYNEMLSFFEWKYPFLVTFQNTQYCLVFPSIDYKGLGIMYSMSTNIFSLYRVNADTTPYLTITKLSLST